VTNLLLMYTVPMEELEFTYLAKELPEGLNEFPSKEMLDIYIPTSTKHPNLRIRKNGNKYEITKKEIINEEDASRFMETTIPLTEEEYKDLSQLSGKRVQKTRFYYKENETTFEVDVFRGDLEGLIVVDVEFDSEDKRLTFTPPAWCLADVTQEEFIAGGMICGKKYSDIEDQLQKFNYKKISLVS